jgi:two-component system invasion response regulator UvrY
MVCGKSARHDGKVTNERVRVWVVDDQASFRLATAAALATMEDFVMAGECETGESAIELIRNGDAGIVLMDIHMPGMGGIEATRRIRAAHPDLMVLLMSTYDVEDLPTGAADCGATAYLHKEQLSPDLLTRLWRAADRGRSGVIRPRSLGKLVDVLQASDGVMIAKDVVPAAVL